MTAAEDTRRTTTGGTLPHFYLANRNEVYYYAYILNWH